MTHISEFANENTARIEGNEPMTVGHLLDALENFPREIPVVLVYTESGTLLGAATNIDGVMGNNFGAEASTFAGLLVDLTANPIPLSKLAQPAPTPQSTPTPDTGLAS